MPHKFYGDLQHTKSITENDFSTKRHAQNNYRLRFRCCLLRRSLGLRDIYLLFTWPTTSLSLHYQLTNVFYLLPFFYSRPSRRLHRTCYAVVFATSVVYHSKLIAGFWDVAISTACGTGIYLDTRSQGLLTWTHYACACLLPSANCGNCISRLLSRRASVCSYFEDLSAASIVIMSVPSAVAFECRRIGRPGAQAQLQLLFAHCTSMVKECWRPVYDHLILSWTPMELQLTALHSISPFMVHR